MKMLFSRALFLVLLAWTAHSAAAAGQGGVTDQLIASRSITTDGATFAQEPFDYLVVGGGTAGLAVVVRLLEDSPKRMGVVEAGIAALEREEVNVPGLFGSGLATDIHYN